MGGQGDKQESSGEAHPERRAGSQGRCCEEESRSAQDPWGEAMEGRGQEGCGRPSRVGSQAEAPQQWQERHREKRLEISPWLARLFRRVTCYYSLVVAGGMMHGMIRWC